MNHLPGKILQKIGDLSMLELFDLSRIELFGLIPKSLSSLNFLSYLNLSFNNLFGKIFIWESTTDVWLVQLSERKQ
jgi:hypothetical protein